MTVSKIRFSFYLYGWDRIGIRGSGWVWECGTCLICNCSLRGQYSYYLMHVTLFTLVFLSFAVVLQHTLLYLQSLMNYTCIRGTVETVL